MSPIDSWSGIQANETLRDSVNVERYGLWGPYVVALLREGLQVAQEKLSIGESDDRELEREVSLKKDRDAEGRRWSADVGPWWL